MFLYCIQTSGVGLITITYIMYTYTCTYIHMWYMYSVHGRAARAYGRPQALVRICGAAYTRLREDYNVVAAYAQACTSNSAKLLSLIHTQEGS